MTMRQLLVECSDPGLVVSLAEEFENVLRRIDFDRAKALHGQPAELASELGPEFEEAWPPTITPAAGWDWPRRAVRASCA